MCFFHTSYMDTEKTYDRIEIEGDRFDGNTFQPTYYEVIGLGFRRLKYIQKKFTNFFRHNTKNHIFIF